MKTHAFEKLSVYEKQGTDWFRVFLFAYLYGLIALLLYLIFDSFAQRESLIALQKSFAGDGITREFVLLWMRAALALTAVTGAFLFPLLDRRAFSSAIVHLIALIAYRPVSLALLYALGAAGENEAVRAFPVYIAAVIFGFLNIAYFASRRELFDLDLTVLVTGEEKDETKH